MVVRQVKDGEWVAPQYQNYVFECCRCGLKHKMEFRVTLPGRGFEMRGWRIPGEKDGDSKSIS